MDRDDLYAQAGVGPEDIDFLETYDDYPVINLLQFEGLGFCREGEGPDFVRANTLRWREAFRSTPRAANCRSGRPARPADILGITEAIRQLTGQPLGAQVPDARHGVVSGFGMINYDRGALLRRRGAGGGLNLMKSADTKDA